MRAGMLFNPAAIAFAGRVFAMRDQDPARHEYVLVLRMVAADAAAARGAAAAKSALDALDRRLRSSILRVAFTAAVYFWHPWDTVDDVKRAADDEQKTFERRKRVATVGGTLRRFFSILIWSAASLMVLRELDVDITPVLAGAGIVGLAVGFGAQTLVKDIISGLFLIAEDQVRLGDVAEINGIGGAVEEINLRTIVLRDFEGVVHHIANGEIRTLANRSKDFSFYVIDIAAGYEDDTDHIADVVSTVAAGLMQDPKYAVSILEPLEVVGVDAFKPSEVTLRFRIKTLPLKQWEVGRELRRRIKKAFDAQGISIPAPQMTVTIKK